MKAINDNNTVIKFFCKNKKFFVGKNGNNVFNFYNENENALISIQAKTLELTNRTRLETLQEVTERFIKMIMSNVNFDIKSELQSGEYIESLIDNHDDNLSEHTAKMGDL